MSNYLEENNLSANPKVSIIVPVYNVEKYLSKCLDSLISQTLKDIEIIVVNDGATDNSPKIIEEYAQKDFRIKSINQKNQGLSGARNTGLMNAKGEFITFVDSDDWLDEDFIEKLYRSAINNNCDIAIGGMKRQREKTFKYRLNYSEEKVYTNLQEKLNICRIPTCCYACGKLFKKELIQNRLFKKGVYFEDVLWTPYVIKESKSLVTIPNTYYFYRANASSIVKSIQSEKKQHDSYVAKKGIVDFYEHNNLVLSNKAKKITKHILYKFGVPVLKIKENNGFDTALLFGFLPIYKTKAKPFYEFKKGRKVLFMRDLDSHFYIDIFGIHLGFKNKKRFLYKEATEYGLTVEKRIPQLIVSLATFPARIGVVHKTLNTLLSQTVKPDRLILWLADSQFPKKEEDLPQEVLKLQEFGLEIRWTEDLKSYKKLVPALKEFPNDIIVTADDDLYYQEDWLESLYNAYLKNPENIYTRRACAVKRKGYYFSIIPHYANIDYEPNYSNQLMGGAGTLYPPNSLYEDIFNIEKIRNLVPTYDDIYFWAMALMKGTKIGLIKNDDVNLYNVENSQNVALCKINNDRGGMSAKDAFNAIFEEYPQIPALLTEQGGKNG